MEEKYLGLYGQNIAKEDIPFSDKLEEFDRIENTCGDTLIYVNGQYRYINNDPTKFLSNNQIYTQWRKR